MLRNPQERQRPFRAAVGGLGLQDVDEGADNSGYRGSSQYPSGSEFTAIALQGKERRDVIDTFEVHPMANNLLVAYWTWQPKDVRRNVKLANIYYFPQGGGSGADNKVRKSRDVSKLEEGKYTIPRVPGDTQYQVCIRVKKQGAMAELPDDLICRGSPQQPWHMPASIGSSVGALLALMVVILVMVSLQRKRRCRRLNGDGLASKRSRIDSGLESQFDSIAFREETSFYDDATTIYDSTSAGPESCLHSSCGANSAVLIGLNTQISASSADTGPGEVNAVEGASSPSASTLDAPPLLGRSVSTVTSGQAKSVTFKEEHKSAKCGLLQKADSDDSREVEPASVVMETEIDSGPNVAAIDLKMQEEKDGGSGGLYTQLIETI